MPDKDAAEVDEHAQLLVGHLERDERMPRVHRVEVAGCEREREEEKSQLEPCGRAGDGRRREREYAPRMPENSVR